MVTDWYESTKQKLPLLFPSLASKDAIIVDDHYSWTGSKQAVDKYLESVISPNLLKRFADTVIGVKIANNLMNRPALPAARNLKI